MWKDPAIIIVHPTAGQIWSHFIKRKIAFCSDVNLWRDFGGTFKPLQFQIWQLIGPFVFSHYGPALKVFNKPSLSSNYRTQLQCWYRDNRALPALVASLSDLALKCKRPARLQLPTILRPVSFHGFRLNKNISQWLKARTNVNKQVRFETKSDTHMFEFQENLSGQLDPLLVDVLDGHQVPLRAAPEANTINPPAPHFSFYKGLSDRNRDALGSLCKFREKLWHENAGVVKTRT